MKTNEIDALVKASMTNEAEENYPVFDGIVNEKEYYKSKFKILWILKEPHGKGIRDMREFIGDNDELMSFKNWKKTFSNIIYVTYSIHNNFKLFEKSTDEISKNPDRINILKKIAFINLKKIAGTTVSKHQEIKKAYNDNRDIISLQIETYNPDIIICGGTMCFIAKDLEIEDKLISKDSIKYHSTNDKVYIDALHPNQRGYQEEYCNGIISVVKDWAVKKK